MNNKQVFTAGKISGNTFSAFEEGENKSTPAYEAALFSRKKQNDSPLSAYILLSMLIAIVRRKKIKQIKLLPHINSLPSKN